MQPAAIRVEWMDDSDVSRIGEIDRSEHITRVYKMDGASLKEEEHEFQVPPWLAEGDGEYTVKRQIEFCREHMEHGGVLLGAFVANTLVGVGLLRPEIRIRMAQLAFLHVSQAYRRHGITSLITRELTKFAREAGANTIYVSATPSASAVGFYSSQGFELAEEPLAELYALEPEDIHMVKKLQE
jgi:predicted N-acetyltransferase YhbS